MYLVNARIRSLTKEDQPFLWEMLYHAIFVAPGDPQPTRKILKLPDIRRYAADWMQREGDIGFAAEVDGQPVGAVWLRCWSEDNKGYGFVDTAVPELSIALLPAFRGRGIGTRLLRHCIHEASHDYATISLSVSSHNPAKKLYLREGFIITGDETDASLTMVNHLAVQT